MTASPQELTAMLYDGAVKFITLGKMSIEQNNIQDANNAIIRAQAIVEELNNTLNMGYELSHDLRKLYTYILEGLFQANLKKDMEILDEVLPFVRELRDTWKEAMKQAKIKKRSSK